MLTVKASIYLFMTIAAVSWSGGIKHSSHNIINAAVPDSEATGHFTRKDKTERVWLIPPVINADETGCVVHGSSSSPDDCVSRLNFSDPTVPAILVNNCIGGHPVNLGDLDNDGLDEIGLLPEWFTSCWRSYHVYTFKQGQWQPAVATFPTHCNQWEANLPPIVKDPAKPGNVIITYSAFEGDAIVFKKKSVKVR